MNDQIIRLLLIEDNPADVVLLEEALAQVITTQFRLINVERLAKGLECLSQEPFDVVLLDLGLPDSQGLAALVKLREHAPRVPIVVLTGLADETLGLKALQQGAQDYLVKGQVEGPGLARIIRYAIERKHVEETLEQQRAFLRQVIDINPHFIFAKDREGRFTLVNQAVAEAYGTSVEELIGKTDADFNPNPAEVEHFHRDDREVLDSGQERSVPEEMFTDASGRMRWLQTVKRPIVGEDGLTYQILGVAIDITARKQAQEALETERYRLRTLIDNLPDLIFLKDTDSRFLVANEATAKFMGASTPEALLGKTDFDFYPPELASQYDALEQQIIRSGEPVVGWEKPQLDLQGKSHWLLTIKTPLRDKQGQIVGLVGVERDITRRKQAEEEVRRRNRELTLLNEIIAASAAGLEPEAVLNIACRELALAFDLPQATATLLNEEKTAALVAAEYRAEGRPSMLGSTIPIRRSPASPYMLQSEGPLVINDVQNDPRLESLRPLLRQNGIASLLILPLQINGELVGNLSLEALELRSFSTEEVNLAWSVADHVAGALARASLTQTQQRLSAAIEQAYDTVIITDTAGRIIHVNPAFERNSGYSRAEMAGQTPRLLKSGQHAAAFYQELWASLSTGQVWRGRFVNKRKDGAIYIEDATITPVRNENDVIVNYVSVQHDVTRELELEEQYRQALKMEAIGRLSGGIAHDFNNLLVVINGYSELLLNRYLEANSPLRGYIEEILKAGERAARLTQQLLAFSRKQELQPKILSLNEVLANLEPMLRRLITEDIDLIARLRREAGQIKADPGQIEQIVLNLVVNARDAMPRGGKLTIETANIELDETCAREHVDLKAGRYVLLAVSDIGLGIAAEIKSHIFEPFFTTKEQGQGTGLGLATVYGIVKQSGGDIRVYSELGHGTTFNIYLPRVDEAMQAPEPDPAHLEWPGGAETILLVEDEASVRDLARQALESSGYTVLEAGDGAEALQVCQKRSSSLIHLLLTDVIMPGGLNGPELAEHLQALRPGLKVLFMSGYTNEAIMHYGVLAPELFFLQKPFAPSLLIRKVREVLDVATLVSR